MVGPPILAIEPEMMGYLMCKSQDTRHNVNQSEYHEILFVIRSRILYILQIVTDVD
jgi:hypothetical protein